MDQLKLLSKSQAQGKQRNSKVEMDIKKHSHRFREIKPSEMHLTFCGKPSNQKQTKQIILSQHNLGPVDRKVSKTIMGFSDAVFSSTATQQ